MDPFTIISLATSIIPTVGKWLGIGGDKADKVASTIDTMAKAISGKDDTKEALEAIKANPQLMLQMQQQWQQFELSMQSELTERHKADMSSTSWLAKNIRPLTLAVMLPSLVAGLFLNDASIMIPLTKPQLLWKFSIDSGMYSDFSNIAWTVFGFYFGGRTVEKGSLSLPFLGRK